VTRGHGFSGLIWKGCEGSFLTRILTGVEGFEMIRLHIDSASTLHPSPAHLNRTNGNILYQSRSEVFFAFTHTLYLWFKIAKLTMCIW
jgi:hypothetical protein